MRSKLQISTDEGPLGAAISETSGERYVVTARIAAKFAVGVSLVLALWLLGNWLARADHVAAVPFGTVDGGPIGRSLSFLTWSALAVAFVNGLAATRRHCTARRVAHGTDSGGKDITTRVIADDEALVGPLGIHHTRWAITCVIGLGAMLVIWTYHGLLRPGAITWGDWGYFANLGAVRSDFPMPSLWSFATLGSNNILGAPLAPIEVVMGIMARLGISYDVLERLWFYFPAVILSYVGPLLLTRRLRSSWPLAVGAGIFYCVNPYALILISGGQLTVGMGYALFPWVAVAAIRLWSTRTMWAGLVLGSVLGIQAWEDPRTAGLSIAGLVVTFLVLAVDGGHPPVRRMPWMATASAGLVFVLLQGGWLVPDLFAVRANLPAGYTTTSALSTFSLLSLADGLTVFHPFWPSMRFIALHSVPALWMIIPVMVALAIARNPLDRRVHVGGALYLLFAALLSGANPPFGVMNSWLFTHVPGMDLFRDPSPYLGPIALGVVVVATAAPWSRPTRQGLTSNLAVAGMYGSERIDVAVVKHRASLWKLICSPTQYGLSLVVSALIVVSAWPALSGELHHNLSPRPVPSRYEQVDHTILNHSAGAVLWIPSTSRFAPVSPEHPSISAFSLEETSHVSFPATVQAFEWLGVPSLVRSVVQRYDISTVVVRENVRAYQNLSLSAKAIRSIALSAFGTLPGVTKTLFPELTVFQVPGSLPYPVAVFGQSSKGGATTRADSGVPSSASASHATQELAQTSFSGGLVGWNSVGDGNDYLHQTLSQAGITASVRGRGDLHWLHLTVAYGAASISQTLRKCPAPGLQELRVRYRSSPSASSLTVLIFSSVQSAPLGEVFFPAASGRWVTATGSFVAAPSIHGTKRPLPLSDCELVLSVAPMVAGTESSTDISSLSLRAKPTLLFTKGVETTTKTAYWQYQARPIAVVVSPSGDTTTATLSAGRRERLVVFWQRYDPRWVARSAGGTPLRHLRVNGWANGFIVPASVHSPQLTIIYGPQRQLSKGLYLVLGGVLLVLAGGVASAGQLWHRKRVDQGPQRL